MDGKTFARSGAIMFVAVVITATAVELTRKEQAPQVEFVPAGEGGGADPLRIALRRCRDMGEPPRAIPPDSASGPRPATAFLVAHQRSQTPFRRPQS